MDGLLRAITPGLGKLSSAVGDVGETGAKGFETVTNSAVKATENTPNIIYFGIIPFVILYILLTILSIMNYLYFSKKYNKSKKYNNTSKKEDKLYIMFIIIFVGPPILSLILAYGYWYIIFMIKNPTLIGISVTKSILTD